ncbi:MAG: hypothetical protein AAGU12_03005 [Clostridiales bacterium]
MTMPLSNRAINVLSGGGFGLLANTPVKGFAIFFTQVKIFLGLVIGDSFLWQFLSRAKEAGWLLSLGKGRCEKRRKREGGK